MYVGIDESDHLVTKEKLRAGFLQAGFSPSHYMLVQNLEL
jgi:hypothetical protein